MRQGAGSIRRENPVARKRNTGQRLAWSRWFTDQLRDRQWSQADFARRSGINTGQVSTWATGQRLPSYESAACIAETLHVAVRDVQAAAGLIEPEGDVDPRIATFVDLMKRVRWTPDRLTTQRALLEAWVEADQRRGSGR